ncbi:MAG: SMC family ATPase [Pyrobaculum sp.]
MIKRLELVNFKAHAKASFKFGEGVNFIHGPNGAGKTTIMEAISVALFGSQWVRRVGGKWSDFLRRGAPYGEVKLYMSAGGKEVAVMRRFTDTGSSPAGTQLLIDGAVVARGDVDVTAALASKFGLIVDEYRHLLYIRQGELRRILQEPEYIDRILRLDEFDKVDELVKEALGELRARRERVGGRVEELEKRLPTARARLEELRRRLAQAEQKARELEESARLYKEAERRYLEARERLASLLKEREELEKKLEDLAHNSIQLEKDLEYLEKELEAALKAREELRRLPQLPDVEREYYELRQLVTAAERVSEEVRTYRPEKLEEARRRLEDLTKRHAELKSRLDLIKDVLRLAQRAEGGRCPVCGSPLTREAVQRHELEAAGLEKEVQRLTKAVEEARSLVKKLEELDQQYQSQKAYLSVDVAAARRRLAELEALYQRKRELEKKAAYLSALASKAADLEKRILELRRRREELEKRVADVHSRLVEVEKEAEALRKEVEKLESQYNSLKKAYEEYLVASSKVAEYRRDAEQLEKEVRQAEAELQGGRAELEKLDKSLEKARHIRNVLGEVKPLARQILLKAINDELNSVFLKLRHKESFRSVSLAELNGRYVIRVNTPGGPMEHNMLSLGEQNLLALALRVALARALIGTAPFIMLDEPTEHLDEEHRRRIVELVRDLTSIVPTVIVTSHLGEFEEVADVVIQLY